MVGWCSSLQAVVMAAGKGSRMMDLTATKPKCLLPVAGHPLIWHPLNMLQTNGFTEAIVIVPDTAKSEVSKMQEKYGLSIKLDVVGISGNEDMGTADSLRLVADKLTGSDIVIVSGDLVMEESMRNVVDLHLTKNSSLTTLLAQTPDLKSVSVPGAKSTKYKKERDLIGLRGNHLCLFTAEADVEEEELAISSKVLRSVGSFTVNSNLLDAHLYIVKRWVCDYIIGDKNISTIKGELLPIVVRKQFSSKTSSHEQEKRKIQDFVEANNKGDGSGRLYSCYALTTEKPVYRVNSMPMFWYCNTAMSGTDNRIHPSAVMGDRAQLSSCSVAAAVNIADKTTLSGVSLGAGTRVMEKVRISNSVIMDNVTIMPGSNIEDCVVCDGVTVGEKSILKMTLVGKGQQVPNNSQISAQTLLDTDRMMEV